MHHRLLLLLLCGLAFIACNDGEPTPQEAVNLLKDIGTKFYKNSVLSSKMEPQEFYNQVPLLFDMASLFKFIIDSPKDTRHQATVLMEYLASSGGDSGTSGFFHMMLRALRVQTFIGKYPIAGMMQQDEQFVGHASTILAAHVKLLKKYKNDQSRKYVFDTWMAAEYQGDPNPFTNYPLTPPEDGDEDEDFDDDADETYTDYIPNLPWEVISVVYGNAVQLLTEKLNNPQLQMDPNGNAEKPELKRPQVPLLGTVINLQFVCDKLMKYATDKDEMRDRLVDSSMDYFLDTFASTKFKNVNPVDEPKLLKAQRNAKKMYEYYFGAIGDEPGDMDVQMYGEAVLSFKDIKAAHKSPL